MESHLASLFFRFYDYLSRFPFCFLLQPSGYREGLFEYASYETEQDEAHAICGRGLSKGQRETCLPREERERRKRNVTRTMGE